MMRALQHANYTFAKKISHTATARTSAIAWSPARALSSHSPTRAIPDYITPALLAANPRAKEV